MVDHIFTENLHQPNQGNHGCPKLLLSRLKREEGIYLTTPVDLFDRKIKQRKTPP